MILTCLAAWGATYLVDPSGGGDTTTIRAAVNLAQAGDTVQISAGTYTETITVSRAITLEGIGGSASTVLAARGASTALTLSADVTVRGLTLSSPDASALLVTAGAVGLEDVVISGSGTSGSTAVIVEAGSIDVVDGAFTGNSGSFGGHVGLGDGVEARFEGCTFSEGAGIQGGAVSVGAGASAEFVDCTFTGNGASSLAGAILVQSAADLVVQGCTFEGNRSSFGDGGAILAYAGAAVDLVDVDFVDNEPSSWETYGYGGGAIFSSAGQITLEDVRFSGNGGWYGGAVWAENGALTLGATRFEGNHARYGGAIRADAAVVSDFGSDFVDNRAEVDGGGVSVVGGSLVLDASGLSRNAAGGSGGAVHLAQVDTTLRNVALDHNSAGGDGGGLWSEGSVLDADTVFVSANVAGGDGGGIWSHVDALGFTLLSVWDNRAARGGGLAVDAAASWRELGSSFADNVADEVGGGVWARDSAVLLDGAAFRGNTTFFGDGGGVAIEGGSLDVVGTSFVDGLATGSGGHVHAAGAPITLTDTTLLDGYAVWGDGGAVWADAGSSGTRLVVTGKAQRGGAVALPAGAAGDRWTNVVLVGGQGGALWAADPAGLGVHHVDVLGGDAGLVIEGGSAVVTDSLFLGVDGAALSTLGATLDGGWNLFWGNGADVAGDLGAPPGGGNLAGDPALVAWSDDDDLGDDVWIPRATSPLLDAGDPTGFDPDGSRADIGVTGGPDADWGDGDGDGVPWARDCDDTDPSTFPGATEGGYDGRDQDCDGLDFDADEDGHDAAEWGGDDCDDADPWVWDDCGQTPTDSGTEDSGTTGGPVEIPGSGVVRSDACGCDRGTGLPWAALGFLGFGWRRGRRRG